MEDFDNNGFVDLFMANYPNTTQDSLGLNNIGGAGAGNFTESTAGRILACLLYTSPSPRDS